MPGQPVGARQGGVSGCASASSAAGGSAATVGGARSPPPATTSRSRTRAGRRACATSPPSSASAPATVAEAAAHGEVVVVATPLTAYATLPRDALAGTVVARRRQLLPEPRRPRSPRSTTTAPPPPNGSRPSSRRARRQGVQTPSTGRSSRDKGDADAGDERLVVLVAGDDADAKQRGRAPDRGHRLRPRRPGRARRRRTAPAARRRALRQGAHAPRRRWPTPPSMKDRLHERPQAGSALKMQTPRAAPAAARACRWTIPPAEETTTPDRTTSWSTVTCASRSTSATSPSASSRRRCKLGFVGGRLEQHRARGPRQPDRQRRGPGPGLRPRRARQRLLARAGRPRRALARALAAPARLPLRLARPAREGGRAGHRVRRGHALVRLRPARARATSRSSCRPSPTGAGSPTPGPSPATPRRPPTRALAIASAPFSPTSASARSVPLPGRSSAGKRPQRGQLARRARRPSISPPNGAGAVAITVSEPPSAMLRAAASAVRAACGGTYSSVSTTTTASPPRAATRRPCSTACSTACACASGEAANVTRGDRRGLGPVGDLLRADAGEHDEQLEALAARRAPRRCRARARSCRRAGAPAIDDARALAERRQPLDRLERHVLGVEREPLGRPRGRQVLELRALGDLVGRAAVDRVDADERREPLRAARRAHRAGDPVAAHELAALDLRGGHVDVVVGRLRRVEADERRAVAEQLDDALGDAVLGRRRAARSRVLVAAAARRGPRGGRGAAARGRVLVGRALLGLLLALDLGVGLGAAAAARLRLLGRRAPRARRRLGARRPRARRRRRTGSR